MDVHSPSKAVFRLIAALILESSPIHARYVGGPLHCSLHYCPIWGHTVKRRPSSVRPAERLSLTETPCPGMSSSILVSAHLNVTNVARPLLRPTISSATVASILVCVLTSVTFVTRPSQWSSHWFVTSAPILVFALTSVTTVIRPLPSLVPDWSMRETITLTSHFQERWVEHWISALFIYVPHNNRNTVQKV